MGVCWWKYWCVHNCAGTEKCKGNSPVSPFPVANGNSKYSAVLNNRYYDHRWVIRGLDFAAVQNERDRISTRKSSIKMTSSLSVETLLHAEKLARQVIRCRHESRLFYWYVMCFNYGCSGWWKTCQWNSLILTHEIALIVIALSSFTNLFLRKWYAGCVKLLFGL